MLSNGGEYATPAIMIELYRVTKRYANGVSALSDVTCTIDDGEFVYLSGPSGAGKTTLVRLLICMEQVSEGQVLVKSRNLRMLRKKSIPFLRRNIGVVFQNFRLLHNRTVFDNVAIGLEIRGIPAAEIRPRVMQTLEMVSLGEYAAAFPQMLSGGEQQRVAIARALVNEPAILVADEPTGNLDSKLSEEILQLLIEVQRRGTTVIVATHDERLMEKFPGRILTLNGGKLVGDTAGKSELASVDIEEADTAASEEEEN